ncbi:hypothetical protein AAVH_09396 [Aphelenchoides avenae]|nr:hypothetical protein AAVH_09396 [Aphelenchus avenae]
MASSSTLSRHSFVLAVLSVAVNAVAAYDPRYAFFRPGVHSASQSLSIFDRPTRSRNASPSLLATAPEFPEFAPHVEEQPFDVPSYFMAMSRSKKDKPIRRCGLRLIKHVQALCNGCVQMPETEPVKETKRKRSEGAGSKKITQVCCEERGCSDEELIPYCCSSR